MILWFVIICGLKFYEINFLIIFFMLFLIFLFFFGNIVLFICSISSLVDFKKILKFYYWIFIFDYNDMYSNEDRNNIV